MNLPSEELEQFKISGLVTRSTRGMSSEQGFIVIILTQLMLIPVTFVAIVYEIALIDTTYALFFLAFAIMRSSSRFLMTSRLSNFFLPLPRAISTLAIPFFR